MLFSRMALCQGIIEGKIVDAETGEPIPFASIGIMGTSKGTSSNLNGQFTLTTTGPASLKITCVGYESKEINSTSNVLLIQLKPSATQLSQVVIFNKPVNAEKIAYKAFVNIRKNYIDRPFLQKFFYRHYCKDDSVYGRLIEAFVDVWKEKGYRTLQHKAGDEEQIRVTQIRRSLDNTKMAQGHEPISVKNILQADVVGYQTSQKSKHVSFYTDVSNLKTDFESYIFEFKGITTYDGEDVYQINYTYKKDSALTTSGRHLILTEINGTLYITTHTHAIVKTEEIKKYGANHIRTSTYYRKYNDRYYPYHLIRDGANPNAAHSFHIDLTSVEIQTNSFEKFVGHEQGREELLKITYDSIFWNNNAILKTTPLELGIIRDLGKGNSLDKQFLEYQQYEMNVSDGGKNGDKKFNWLKGYSRGKKSLYLFFWKGDCMSYLADVERLKQLHKKYRNQISCIFLSLEGDESQWKKIALKYNLASDGIINYRIGQHSEIEKLYKIDEIPSFVLIARSGEVFDNKAKPPSDPLLEEDFKLLLKK